MSVSSVMTLASMSGATPDRSDEITMAGSVTYVRTVPSPGLANLQLRVNSDGDLTVSAGVSPAPGATEWHTDNPSAGLGDDWQIRCTKTAGTDPDVGNLNTWEDLSTDRFWQYLTTTSKTCTLTFDFRLKSYPGTIQKTVTGVILDANVI